MTRQSVFFFFFFQQYANWNSILRRASRTRLSLRTQIERNPTQTTTCNKIVTGERHEKKKKIGSPTRANDVRDDRSLYCFERAVRAVGRTTWSRSRAFVGVRSSIAGPRARTTVDVELLIPLMCRESIINNNPRNAARTRYGYFYRRRGGDVIIWTRRQLDDNGLIAAHLALFTRW